MSYTLVRGSLCQIWWPESIFEQFDLWLTPDDPYMSFDPSYVLYFDQRFLKVNFVAMEHS